MPTARIRSLQEEWYQIENTRDCVAFSAFRSQLYLTTKEHIELGSKTGDCELAQLWLNRTRFFIETNPHLTILSMHLEKVMTLLAKPSVVENLSKIKANTKELAALCLQCSAITATSNYGLPKLIVEDIISRWFELYIKTERRYTPEEVVGILYGPIVWSVYSNDVDEYEELPAHLYRSNVPVLTNEMKHRQSIDTMLNALPATLC